MKARLHDFSILMGGRQRVSFDLDADFREGYESLKGADLEISVRRWKPRRSRDANAYFHVLVNKIAEVRGISDTEVKRSLVLDYGVYDRDDDGNIIGCMLPASADIDRYHPYARCYKTEYQNGREYKCYLFYKHTHEMDTKEMSRLIEGAITVAKELNIDCDTPERQSWWDSLQKGETNVR